MGRKRERELTEAGVQAAALLEEEHAAVEITTAEHDADSDVEDRSAKKKKNSKKEKREKQNNNDIEEDYQPIAEAGGQLESASSRENNEGGNSDAPAATSRLERPLPPGYICRACNQSGHAIYDCPIKVSKIRSDPKKTVFVSHLPRSWKRENILSFLNGREIAPDAISNIKMVTSETDGVTEFKGIALVTVIGLEALSKILQLNGEKVADRDIVVKINEPKKREPVKHCFRCGGIHDPTTCNNPRICDKCRTSGHLSSECPKRSRSK